MTDSYTAYAPHYDRQGLSQWSATLIAFVQQTLLPRYQRQPRTALDLACGTGTAAIQLATAGLWTVGLDRSLAMLAVAQAKARQAQAACQFVCADLRAFAFQQPFDLITCIFDSLNYLTDPADLVQGLRQVRAALADNGLFICDLTTARAYESEPAEPTTFDLGAVAYRWATAWHPASQQAATTLSVITRENGIEQTVTEDHRQRAYSQEEVRLALESAGLHILNSFAVKPVLELTLEPPTADDARILYVATTQAGTTNG